MLRRIALQCVRQYVLCHACVLLIVLLHSLRSQYALLDDHHRLHRHLHSHDHMPRRAHYYDYDYYDDGGDAGAHYAQMDVVRGGVLRNGSTL